ncbi:MAG TPA: GntR family transcriptional regulator [Jiangellaceae bacterium]|nr:GntR family transcriptional regulator [Jiangellaceae bacterium]
MSVVDGPVPKHRQLREILLALVDGELTPDSPIPSERELVSRFGISRATVREAVGRLVSEGRLYRVRGKGTFVAAPRVESLLHLASFTEDMRRRGHKPSTVVLGADESVPPPPARTALGLDVTDRAYRIERLRSADGAPMAHEVSWLPARPLPGLLEHDLSGSVYTLLTREYGRTLDSAAQTVWAEGADPLRARLLRVPPAAPLLVFRRTSYAAGRPMEHVTSWYRADRYQVHMTLDRTSPAGSASAGPNRP